MIELINGDCLVEMKRLHDEGVKVQSIVTDPPYHLQSIAKRYGNQNSAPAKNYKDGAFSRASKGFLGKEWDGGDIAFRAETWKLCYDLLDDGGMLLAFTATRNYHRMAIAIESAGFTIIDMIHWQYSTGHPMCAKTPDGIRARLKPAHEPIAVAQKGHDARRFSIDVCRIPHGYPMRTGIKKTGNMPFHNRQETIEMPRPAHDHRGLYPCNVMQTGISSNYFNKAFHIKKPNAAEKWFGQNVYIDPRHSGVSKIDGKTTDDVQSSERLHPTVKPIELMLQLVRLVTPPDGACLDPFMGSGTTGIACKMAGLNFVGIEREKEYYELAKKRIDAYSEIKPVNPNMQATGSLF